MRKQTILSVAGLALAAGLGYAAMSSAGLAPGIAPQADAAEIYVPLKSSEPANNAVIPDWQGVSQFTLTYTTGLDSFSGIELNKENTSKIEIRTLGVGGSFTTLAEINPSDASLVSIDAKYPDNAIVKLPSDVTLTAGPQYALYVPSGVFKGIVGFGEDGDAGGTYINAETTVKFQLNDAPRWESVPSAGSTAALAVGQLNNPVISFPDASKVEVSADNYQAGSIKLYYNDPAAKADANGKAETHKAIGVYTPTVDGTDVKLALTLNEGASLVTTSKTTTYEIEVPANAFDVTKQGNSYATGNLAIDIADIKLVWMSASDIKLVEPEEEFTFTPQTAPKEVILQLPMKMAVNGNPTATLKKGTSTVANYSVALAPNGQTVTCTMKAATSTTSAIGNPQFWENGEYTFNLPANAFKDIDDATKKTTAGVYGKWTMTGGYTVEPIVSYSINPFDTKETVTEENFGAVKANPGVNAIRVRFLNAMKLNDANTTAKLALYKDGVAEPVFEQSVSEGFNTGHVWFAKPNTSGTSTTKNSSNVNIIYGLTGTPADKSVALDYLKTPGNYTLKIDAGYFVTNSSTATKYENGDIEVKFTILPDYTIEVAPANEANLEEIKEVTLTYPEGATIAVNADTKVTLHDKTQLSLQQKQSLKATFKVAAKDNVVTLSLDEPWIGLAKYGMQVVIPAGSWNVTYQGETAPNGAMDYVYYLDTLKPGNVTPAPTEGDATIAPADLASIEYTSTQVKISGPAAPKAELYKVEAGEDNVESRVLVASYTAVGPAEGEAAVESVTFTTADDLSALADGKYVFVIASNALKYSGAYTTDKDFEYVYNVATPAKPLEFDEVFRYTTTEPVQDSGSYLMIRFSWEIPGTAENVDAVAKNASAPDVVLKRDGVEFMTMKASDVTFQPASYFESFDMYFEGSIDMMFIPTADLESGHYELVVPDGLFTYNGTPVQGVTKEFNYTAPEPGATYVLNPEAGTTVNSFNDIRITFPGYDNISKDWNNAIANLKSEDGSVNIDIYAFDCESYNYGEGLIFHFNEAAPNAQWVNGKYTLTVNSNGIVLDVSATGENIYFEGCTVEYTLDYIPPVTYNLADHVQKSFPATENVDWASSNHLGMSKIMLALDNAMVEPNKDLMEAITLDRLDPDGQVNVGIIFPANTDQLKITFRDDEPGIDPQADDFYAIGDINLIFSQPGWEGFEDFTKGGQYVLTIPDGVFNFNDNPMKGMQITYLFDDKDVSVALVGIGGASSYNVFTLDGKAVLLNAAPEQLLDLEPGFYVINGQKTLLRK